MCLLLEFSSKPLPPHPWSIITLQQLFCIHSCPLHRGPNIFSKHKTRQYTYFGKRWTPVVSHCNQTVLNSFPGQIRKKKIKLVTSSLIIYGSHFCPFSILLHRHWLCCHCCSRNTPSPFLFHGLSSLSGMNFPAYLYVALCSSDSTLDGLAKEALYPISLYPTTQFDFLKVIFYHVLKCVCLPYIFVRILHQKASLVPQTIKSLLAMQETWVQSLGQEDPLEKETVTLSSHLAWRIPWTEEPGRLQSTGSQSIGHDWAADTHSPWKWSI